MKRILTSLALALTLLPTTHVSARSAPHCPMDSLVRSARILPLIARCARAPRVLGTVDIEAATNENGLVTSADVLDSSEILSAQQRECMENALRVRLVGAHLPSGSATAVSFTVHLIFERRSVRLAFVPPVRCRGFLSPEDF